MAALLLATVSGGAIIFGDQPGTETRATQVGSCHRTDFGGVAAERLKRMARGFSLPGWTDQWPVRPPSQSLLSILHAKGMTHIRLPLTLEMISPAFSPSDVIERTLKQLDQAVSTATSLGYAVSIDMHPGGQFQKLHVEKSDEALKILIAAWRVVARRYAGLPADSVFFEVLNEPVVSSEVWAAQGPQVVEAIRSVAPEHTLIYGPAFYQRIDALTNLVPLEQSNVVYAVHFYDPMSFTHQGQTWGPEPPAPGPAIPFPSRFEDLAGAISAARRAGDTQRAESLAEQFAEPWTPRRIKDLIGEAAAWSTKTGHPVIMNEFGVLSFKAHSTDRSTWIRATRSAAESFCIGWAHWEYADGFGFVNRRGMDETVDPEIEKALLPP